MPEIILSEEKSEPEIKNTLADAKKLHGFSYIGFYSNFFRLLYSFNNTGNCSDPHQVPYKIRLLKAGKLHKPEIQKGCNENQPAPKQKIK